MNTVPLVALIYLAALLIVAHIRGGRMRPCGCNGWTTCLNHGAEMADREEEMEMAGRSF